MYLVCYILKDNDTKRQLWQLARALMGPSTHCELVFVKDHRCDSLVISLSCPNGHPTFDEKKYETKTDRFHVTWYKFNQVNHNQICAARVICERLVKDNSYQMSTSKLVGSVLPSHFQFAYVYLFLMLFRTKAKIFDNTNSDSIPIHCAGLCAQVLKDACDWEDIPTDGSISDLVCYLIRKKEIIHVATPFGDRKHWRIRDIANHQRSYETILEENYLV